MTPTIVHHGKGVHLLIKSLFKNISREIPLSRSEAYIIEKTRNPYAVDRIATLLEQLSALEKSMKSQEKNPSTRYRAAKIEQKMDAIQELNQRKQEGNLESLLRSHEVPVRDAGTEYIYTYRLRITCDMRDFAMTKGPRYLHLSLPRMAEPPIENTTWHRKFSISLDAARRFLAAPDLETFLQGDPEVHARLKDTIHNFIVSTRYALIRSHSNANLYEDKTPLALRQISQASTAG